jgi:hypothetical protein
MEEIRNAHKMVHGKPLGKRELRTHKGRRDDNIKIVLKELVCEV